MESSPGHRPSDSTLDREALARLCRRLAHISGASMPPEMPERPEEVLRFLESLVEICGRQMERRRNDQVTQRQERTQIERLKNEFLQNVSHELRTPLASIEGFAMALQRGMGRGGQEEMAPETRQRFLSIISQEARRLGELIEDLLEISEIEARPRNTSPALFSAHEVFLEAYANFRSRWGEEKAAPVRMELRPPTEGPVVFANREAIREVLRHLLDNAHKFSGGQEITLGAEPVSEGAHARVCSRLWVRDRGIGIPRSEHPRLFTKFHRIENAAHTFPGTGLGLAIARALVNQNGGEISAESELGQGATFTIVLPAEKPHRPAEK